MTDHPDGAEPDRDAGGNAIPRDFFLGENQPAGHPGTATPNGNNCLIHSLYQLVSGEMDCPATRPAHDAICAAARRRLVEDHMCDPARFLDFETWAERAIHALGFDHSGFTATCFSKEFPGGSTAGDGPKAIQLLNQGNCHFVPLVPANAVTAPPPSPSGPEDLLIALKESPCLHDAPAGPATPEWMGTPMSAETPEPARDAEDGRQPSARPKKNATAAQNRRDSDPRPGNKAFVQIARNFGDPINSIQWAVQHGLLYLPPRCKSGHKWRRHVVAGRGKDAKKIGLQKAVLKCTHKMEPTKGADGKARKSAKGRKVKKQCTSTATTRPAGSLFTQTHASHGDYLCAVWCFAQKMSRGQVVAMTGLYKDVVTDLYHNIRLAALDENMDVAEGEFLGGGNRVVVIDECYVARRKYNKGRVVPTHKKCIFGGVEIEPKQGADADGGQDGGRPVYVETGRCFLAEIPDRAKETFKGQISKRVLPQSTVWTDARASYQWLEPEGGYKHQTVNHSVPEFVGSKGQSTNAAEGMWSRVKRGLRMSNVRKPVDDDYAPLLAEFIWRPRNVRGPNWRKEAFGKVSEMITSSFGAAFQQEQWVASGFDCAGEASLYAKEAY